MYCDGGNDRSQLQSNKYEGLSTWNQALCRWDSKFQLKLTLCSHHRSAAPQNASLVWNQALHLS
jgi:hypothetical protein